MELLRNILYQCLLVISTYIKNRPFDYLQLWQKYVLFSLITQ